MPEKGRGARIKFSLWKRIPKLLGKEAKNLQVHGFYYKNLLATSPPHCSPILRLMVVVPVGVGTCCCWCCWGEKWCWCRDRDFTILDQVMVQDSGIVWVGRLLVRDTASLPGDDDVDDNYDDDIDEREDERDDEKTLEWLWLKGHGAILNEMRIWWCFLNVWRDL